MKTKFFSVMAIFLISFGFLGTNSIEQLGASEFPKESETQMIQEEQRDDYAQTRFVCGGICTAIAAGVGVSAALAVMGTLYNMGFQQTCQRYEHKSGFDILCDTSKAFRDYGLNGKRY